MRAAIIFLTAVLCSSCAIFAPNEPAKAAYVMYEWHDDGGPEELAAEIDLTTQKATFTRGSREVGWCFVSTGKEVHMTPSGIFHVSEMVVDKYSTNYGWITAPDGSVSNGDAKPSTPVPVGHAYHPSPMKYWMRLTWYGVGMHAGDIPRPGVAASHGCVRLPRDFAPILYKAVKVGTSVRVIRSGPHRRGQLG
ncbi:MAG: L,D-transpeptidase [Verrucomicrobiota bacterium]